MRDTTGIGGWKKLAFHAAAALSLLWAGWSAAAPVRNVILFIGDGMGVEHVKAGRLFLGSPLVFENWKHAGLMTTHSASSPVTDSGASGTAMATGVKVNNGVIAMARPGDGSDLETILEFAQARGKSGGLVTTVTATHATPATFGAHATNRADTAKIAADYLKRTRPQVLMGGGGSGLSADAARDAGYLVATNRATLPALKSKPGERVAGLFGKGYLPYESDGVGDLPHLSEMTDIALRILDTNPKGFFLMVEGGLIDQASHGNRFDRCVGEVVEFSRAVETALQWANGRNDTLIIVTADHETGGLKIVEDHGAGRLPKATWSSKGHTRADVPVYLWGPGAEKVGDVKDNTDIHRLMVGAFGEHAMPQTD